MKGLFNTPDDKKDRSIDLLIWLTVGIMSTIILFYIANL